MIAKEGLALNSSSASEFGEKPTAVAAVMLYHDLTTNKYWVLFAGLLKEDIGKYERSLDSRNGDDADEIPLHPVFLTDNQAGFNWGGVSGGVREGETPTQALRRETQEETNLSSYAKFFASSANRHMRLKPYLVNQYRPASGNNKGAELVYKVDPRAIIIDQRIFEESLNRGFEAYCLDMIDDDFLKSIRPAVRPIVEQLQRLLLVD
jgi:8-oxo-dGTP pyrophosphatase MutT (NUDIX family)